MVIWADPAKSDLRAIHDFIASDSKYYAKKVVQDIVDRTKEIGGHDAASCPPISPGSAGRCRRQTMKI